MKNIILSGLKFHPKLGYAYRTYRPVGLTCPSECPFLNNGCYAQSGPTAIHQNRAEGKSLPLVNAFKKLMRGALVRHMVSGDLFINDEADQEAIEEIKAAHKARPDVRGWSYTHGWRRLDAASLNLSNLTYNASCETPEDVKLALQSGWPAVMVVSENHPKRQDYGEFVAVVCPNQTADITCDRCQLCLKKDRKISGKPLVIAFRVHGARRKAAEKQLK
jgi:hypothetical protein